MNTVDVETFPRVVHGVLQQQLYTCVQVGYGGERVFLARCDRSSLNSILQFVHDGPAIFQETVAMTFPADGTVFTIFGALSPAPIYCLNCCFVSGV